MGAFKIGRLLMTRGVADKTHEDCDFSDFVSSSLARYINRDWGELCDEEKALNDEAILNGERIMGAYIDEEYDWKIWIITEWDRSCTTNTKEAGICW